jgi:putative hemolysin
MLDDGVKNAALLQKVKSDPHKLLSAVLIGNNIVNILASSVATAITMNICSNIGIKADNGIAFSTLLMTVFVLIFGEITPKTYATKNCEKVSLAVVKPISVCVFVFTPFIHILSFITNGLLRLLGVDPAEKSPSITESEFITLVNVGHEEGVIETEEREMINNVVDFGNSEAKEIMIPRTDLTALKAESTLEEVIAVFEQAKHSKCPVYRENLDDIIGIVSYKDIAFIDRNKPFRLEDHIRKPYFTYESKSAKELFGFMRSKRITMAVVLDEYGGTSGIITLVDLLEEIVGDINDEYDEANEEIKTIAENTYIVEGSTKIEDVNEALNIELESEDFGSIGGYVIGLLGHFPQKGEKVESENVSFSVEETFRNRIEKLRLVVNNSVNSGATQ